MPPLHSDRRVPRAHSEGFLRSQSLLHALRRASRACLSAPRERAARPPRPCPSPSGGQPSYRSSSAWYRYRYSGRVLIAILKIRSLSIQSSPARLLGPPGRKQRPWQQSRPLRGSSHTQSGASQGSWWHVPLWLCLYVSSHQLVSRCDGDDENDLNIRYKSRTLCDRFQGLASLAITSNSFETLESWSDFSSIIMRRTHGVEIAKLQWKKLLKKHGRYKPRESHRRRLTEMTGNATTTAFESFDLMLMFKDDSERPLSAKTLNSIMKVQSAVARMKVYQAQCLVHAPTIIDAGECIVASSPVNWVAAFLGSKVQVDQAAWQNKSLRTAQKAAQCLNIAIGRFIYPPSVQLGRLSYPSSSHLCISWMFR